jgi:hypothetical protein
MTTTPLLLDGRWYASASALEILSTGLVIGTPHRTPDGKAVLVFDRGGLGSIVNGNPSVVLPCLVPQNQEGHDLMTVRGDRVVRLELDPAGLADLERLAEFDHLPEGRKAGPLADGLHKPGDRLA